MADQVILLRDGRVEQDGAPEDLYAAPPPCSPRASSARRR